MTTTIFILATVLCVLYYVMVYCALGTEPLTKQPD